MTQDSCAAEIFDEPLKVDMKDKRLIRKEDKLEGSSISDLFSQVRETINLLE